ncbi:MAG: hypothetical protein OXB99_10165 [Acidimicrobiaceae bacterium]|nr:hypothetical protein [Acidimicrobiaceae bacterium]
MSPLLFLAIAIVVPLLGMLVLGVGARIKNQKVTDDETEPFRRRLASLTPRSPSGRLPGTPGLARAMRRLRGSGDTIEAEIDAGANAATNAAAGAATSAATGVAAGAATGAATSAAAGAATGAAGDAAVPVDAPAAARGHRTKPTTASIRLIERDYSVPQLPPFNVSNPRPAAPANTPNVLVIGNGPDGLQSAAHAAQQPQSAARRHDAEDHPPHGHAGTDEENSQRLSPGLRPPPSGSPPGVSRNQRRRPGS